MKRIAKLPPPRKPAGDPAVEEFDAAVATAEKNKQKKQRAGRPGNPGNLNASQGQVRRRNPLAAPPDNDEPPDEIRELLGLP